MHSNRNQTYFLRVRSEAGQGSDLMSATGCLLPQVEVDDVWIIRIGQECFGLAKAI